MVIKTDNERLFVDLDEVDAVWSDDYRRDHYNVGVGAHTFEVSRQAGDLIIEALEKHENEIARILDTANKSLQEISRGAKAAIDVTELRRVLYDVLKQWSDDTAGQPNNKALWEKAMHLLKTIPADPSQQVTS